MPLSVSSVRKSDIAFAGRANSVKRTIVPIWDNEPGIMATAAQARGSAALMSLLCRVTLAKFNGQRHHEQIDQSYGQLHEC